MLTSTGNADLHMQTFEIVIGEALRNSVIVQ